MHSLRTRLILSHLLPLLIVVPLAALSLIYLIETQVLLVDLSESLQEQALLIAEAADRQPGVWKDGETAQIYLADMSGRIQARVTLLAPTGYVLAASEQEIVGQQMELPYQAGGHDIYSIHHRGGKVDVWVPVTGANEEVVGIVRTTNQLATVSDRFWRLRQMVLGIVVAELVLGALVGLVLALRLERPLRAVTGAVDEIAAGRAETGVAVPGNVPEEIRHLFLAVNRLGERLQFTEETRRRLLGNVVHELGRPLGALRAAVQALLGGAAADQALREELLTGMDAELRTLQTLLDDLARLHSQTPDVTQLERRPLPLGDWLVGLLPPWREAAQAKGITWENNIPPALPTLSADPERLAQAVGNLLSNAIKHTPVGGKITVSAGREPDSAWIAVSNSGLAIPLEEQERIFEPFYRGARQERFPQGLGLGLTIARDLVAAHGGQIALQSTGEEGSTFTIHLPIAGKRHLSSP